MGYSEATAVRLVSWKEGGRGMKKGKQERAGKLPDEREVKDEAVGTAIGERRKGE